MHILKGYLHFVPQNRYCGVPFITYLNTKTNQVCSETSVASSHISLVIAGIFVINIWGIVGSVLLILGHGLCSSGLFCLSSITY